MLSPAPTVLRASTGMAGTRALSSRLDKQGTAGTERQNDDLGAALRDHLAGRRFLVARAADFSSDKFLEFAQARLQQIDPLAGLLQRGAGGVEHQPLAVPFRQRCDAPIEIVGNAERQTAAGDDIVCPRRRGRERVEAALLIGGADFGSGQDEAILVAGPPLFDGQAFAGEPGDGDGLVGNAFLVQQIPDHLARRTAGREDRQCLAAERMDRRATLMPPPPAS